MFVAYFFSYTSFVVVPYCSYDPLKHCVERRIVRMAKNMTKSQKEEFRQAERKRHQYLLQKEKEEQEVS